MTLKIEIDLDNAAFEPDAGSEVARILRALADKVSGCHLTVAGGAINLRDINGNRVGGARIVKG